MDEEALERRLAAALDAEVTVSRGPVRFTVYCGAGATGRVQEQLSEAGTEISFETRR